MENCRVVPQTKQGIMKGQQDNGGSDNAFVQSLYYDTWLSGICERVMIVFALKGSMSSEDSCHGH